jgi:hypothetical protein
MSIECPVCHAVSHHRVDAATGWCSRCERFTGKTADEVRAAAAATEDPGVAIAILRRLDKHGASRAPRLVAEDDLRTLATNNFDGADEPVSATDEELAAMVLSGAVELRRRYPRSALVQGDIDDEDRVDRREILVDAAGRVHMDVAP